MNKCPVCNSKIKEKYQQYCNTCAWELEWFFGELSEDAKKEYFSKLKIHKTMYLKSQQKGDSGNDEVDEPSHSYFGLRYLFKGIYLFTKYFIKLVSWLILLGLLVVVFSLIFEKLNISFGIFSDDETGGLVGSGIFIIIVIVYIFNKVKK